jgi:hypothetical protein
MKPLKISLFVFSVLGALLLVTLLSRSVELPGMRKEQGFGTEKLLIKYPTIDAFLDAGKKIENLKADSVIMLLDTGVPEPLLAKSIPDFSKIDTLNLERISYPSNNPQLKSEIAGLLSSGRCRILHYGDSQLEGDRISGYLRNRLQSVYGGNGPGFLPIRQVYHQMAAEIIVSDNWLRYAAFDPTQAKTHDKNYGLYASLSRFTAFDHYQVDSAMYDSLAWVKAEIIIRPSKSAYGNLRRYNKIGLHYGNAAYPVKIAVSTGQGPVTENRLIADKAYHCFEILTNTTPDEIKIELESRVSPDFYGITLDGNSGISLDNIAMRGASGTVFNTINPQSFRAMVTRLNPEIVIFQYGGNTVPYVKDSAAIDNYARYLSGNIKWVLRQIPGAKVIFIGPSDMSTMMNGNMATYPLLPYLDRQLKNTCMSNGWAYWSMYEAMGGENSMAYWVEQGLAANDYTHFSPKGTRIISELFFTAFYLDLKK